MLAPSNNSIAKHLLFYSAHSFPGLARPPPTEQSAENRLLGPGVLVTSACNAMTASTISECCNNSPAKNLSLRRHHRVNVLAGAAGQSHGHLRRHRHHPTALSTRKTSIVALRRPQSIGLAVAKKPQLFRPRRFAMYKHSKSQGPNRHGFSSSAPPTGALLQRQLVRSCKARIPIRKARRKFASHQLRLRAILKFFADRTKSSIRCSRIQIPNHQSLQRFNHEATASRKGSPAPLFLYR